MFYNCVHILKIKIIYVYLKRILFALKNPFYENYLKLL